MELTFASGFNFGLGLFAAFTLMYVAIILLALLFGTGKK
jgi:hypothetical protein